VIDIHEYRARQVPQRADRSSLLPTTAGAIIAFALSALTVLYWDKIPGPSQWMPLMTGSAESNSAPSFSGNRIGRSETAPLLKICVTKDLLDIDADREINPEILLGFLVSARNADRLTAVLGGKREHGAVETAAKWAAVADCVYRADSWNLCDIDNRALAVQAANTFVVQVDQIASNPESFAADQSEVGSLTQVKSRVLDSLRYFVKTGALIASDFSPFAPASVRQALSEIKPEKNACAKQ
jgi:hypothetical protein